MATAADFAAWKAILETFDEETRDAMDGMCPASRGKAGTVIKAISDMLVELVDMLEDAYYVS
jgi:hypothetical protein